MGVWGKRGEEKWRVGRNVRERRREERQKEIEKETATECICENGIV